MEIIKFVQIFANPFLDQVFKYITMLGEESFFIIFAAIIFWCLDKNLGYRLGFAYLGNVTLNLGIKETWHTARPIGQPGIRSFYLETAEGYSFPSGHTQSVASLATSLSIYFRKGWMYLIGLLVIILMAISRLYLGVHWPVDVIWGAIIGSGWVFVSNWFFDYAERTHNQLIFAIPIGLILAGFIIFPTPSYGKASGAALGFLAGYFIEPTLIGYQTKAAFWKQIVKFGLGIAGLMAIRILLKKLLPQVPVSDFGRYFIIGSWVTIIAPYLFKALFNGKTA